MAPPRPLPSVEASRRLSAGVHVPQSPLTPPCTAPQPGNMMSVPPVDNNNVIYSNSNDIPVNDWTDDEWDDDDDDEEDEDMQVSNIRSIICSVVLRVLL